MRSWFGVVAGATMTLGASVVAVLASDAAMFLKVLLGALGAGAGALVVGGVVFLVALAVAPHRQQKEAWRQVDERRHQLAGVVGEAENREVVLRAEIERVGRVTADIDHLQGCPRHPARVESYAQTREDGIRVMVGRCIECGASAYRHGDVAVATASPERNRTPVEELSAVLGDGRVLRTRLLLEASGHWGEAGEFVAHDSVPIGEDPLYLWARRALEVLAEHFPEQADEFHGEGRLADGYFMLAFHTESGDVGRGAYLERRIALIARLLDRARSVG